MCSGVVCVLVNCVLIEYFKLVKLKLLVVLVIMLVFEDWKGGCYKIISFYVKCVCGLMVCFVVENCIIDLKVLKVFVIEGYVFDVVVLNDLIYVYCWCIGE